MSSGPGSPSHYPRTTRVAHWPAADCEAWKQALHPGFLEEGSRAAAWSDHRRRNAEFDMGRFISWLASQDAAALGACPVADLTTPQRLARFARDEQRRGLKATSLVTALGNIIGIASSLAPLKDWSGAWAVLDKGKALARRQPPSPRHLVQPDALYGLGLDLMDRSLDPQQQVGDLEAWQDGLIIALLIAVPLRISNFAALRVGQHLRQVGGTWAIDLAEGETKTRRADSWPIPDGLVSYLEHHLQTVRPELLSRARKPIDTGALWLGAFGQPLGRQGLRRRITVRTHQAFGRPMLPHSFRHATATGLALDHPDRPRDAAALLGHASFQTTERHYILSQRHLALQTLHGLLNRWSAASGRTCRTRQE